MRKPAAGEPEVDPRGDPNYVGPPPARPVLEELRTPVAVHLLLTILTFGLWVIVWLLAPIATGVMNRGIRERHAQEVAEWESEYDQWQRRYHEVYGTVPPAAAV